MAKQSKAEKSNSDPPQGTRPIYRANTRPTNSSRPKVQQDSIRRPQPTLSNQAQFFEQQAEKSIDGQHGQDQIQSENGAQLDANGYDANDDFIAPDDQQEIGDLPVAGRNLAQRELQSGRMEQQDQFGGIWNQLSIRQKQKFGNQNVFEAWKVMEKGHYQNVSSQLLTYIYSNNKRGTQHSFFRALKKKSTDLLKFFAQNQLYQDLDSSHPFVVFNYFKCSSDPDFDQAFLALPQYMKKTVWLLFMFQSCQFVNDMAQMDKSVLGSNFDVFLKAASLYNLPHIVKVQEEQNNVGFTKVKFSSVNSAACASCLAKNKSKAGNIKCLCDKCGQVWKVFAQQLSTILLNCVYVKKADNSTIVGGHDFPYRQVIKVTTKQIRFTDPKQQFPQINFSSLVLNWFQKIKQFIIQDGGYRLAEIWKNVCKFLISPNLNVRQCGYYTLVSSSNFNGQYNSLYNVGIDCYVFLIQGGYNVSPIDYWIRQYTKGQVIPFFMSSKGMLISPAYTPINQWTKQLMNYQVTQDILHSNNLTAKSQSASYLKMAQSFCGLTHLPNDEVFTFFVKQILSQMVSYSLGSAWSLAAPVKKQLEGKGQKKEAVINPVVIKRR